MCFSKRWYSCRSLSETALWTADENGFRNLAIPACEHEPLGEDEQRFFVLHPDRDQASLVRCDLEVSPVLDAPPYIAVKNARGYRLLEDPIEVNREARSSLLL